VGQKLLLVNRCKCLDRLQLYDHLAFDKKVGPESFLEYDTFVFEPERLLSFYFKATILQCSCQKGFIDGFQ
jgi:hypothetical protein